MSLDQLEEVRSSWISSRPPSALGISSFRVLVSNLLISDHFQSITLKVYVITDIANVFIASIRLVALSSIFNINLVLL